MILLIIDFRFILIPRREIVKDRGGNCRFVKDVLHIRKRRKDLFGRAPVERTHGEIVVLSVPDSKLLLEVFEGKELVVGIEIFIVFAMAALDLAVVPGREGLDAFVLNTKLIQRYFKERFLICAL